MSYGVPLLLTFSSSKTFSSLIPPAIIIITFQASRRSLFGLILSLLLWSSCRYYYYYYHYITTIIAAIMEDNGGIKLTGIKQIVRLKELLHKWQTATLSPKGGSHHHHHESHHFRCSSDPLQTSSTMQQQHGGISPAISRRLMGGSLYCDSDEDTCQSPEPPHDVPKGYLAVYVGPELRRFIIPTSYLTEPVFKVLLEKVEEEFGFDHSGGLTIPCEIETFKYLLNYLETHQNAAAADDDQPASADHHHHQQHNNNSGTSSVAVEE